MMRLRKARKSSKQVDWVEAPDIAERALKLITTLEMDWVLYDRLRSEEHTSELQSL
jgi:hypothetical protein